MKQSRNSIGMLVMAGVVMAFAGYSRAQEQPVRIAGASCVRPSVLHCPDKDCPGDRVINPGPVVEMKTRRTYFLDYHCDLKPGEKVTFILSLHGGGSYGNWQRHYFPILDYVDKYRLVIATPNSPIRVWSAADDEYLQNSVDSIVGQVGKENIKAFWLVGHSQGGMTSNRIVRTDFFKDKVDGWLSLSGGRLGGNPGRAASFGVRPAGAGTPATPATPATGTTASGAASTSAPGGGGGATSAAAALREPPDADGPRRKPEEIVDSKAGYVYDSTRQNPPNPAWGLPPAPGKAHVYVYPDCKDSRIVADIVRIDKGHTEGLEPKITEELVKLMLSAKGGKIQQAR